MNETETDAYYIIKRKKIKGASALAKELGVTRQHAHRIIESLKEKKLITYQPAQWRAL